MVALLPDPTVTFSERTIAPSYRTIASSEQLPATKTSFTYKNKFACSCTKVRADIPFVKVRRLKAVTHSTFSSPRCTSTPYELITFSAKYSTAKSHIPIISRREKTQRDKRLKKMRGPARCQSGDGRARPGRTSKETEKRTRTSDTRGKKRGRKSEPPRLLARGKADEGSRSSPATLFPSRRWAPR
jgi:hypothetical protein